MMHAERESARAKLGVHRTAAMYVYLCIMATFQAFSIVENVAWRKTQRPEYKTEKAESARRGVGQIFLALADKTKSLCL